MRFNPLRAIGETPIGIKLRWKFGNGKTKFKILAGKISEIPREKWLEQIRKKYDKN